jgi:two-component system, NtrC family, response regulator HydG
VRCALLHYGFPGNIRELQNLVERGVISTDDGTSIDVHHKFRREQLSEETLLAIGAHGALAPRADDAVPNLLLHLQQALGHEPMHLPDLEARLLREAVEAESGNLSAAARRLGLSRGQLAYRLERAGKGL